RQDPARGADGLQAGRAAAGPADDLRDPARVRARGLARRHGARRPSPSGARQAEPGVPHRALGSGRREAHHRLVQRRRPDHAGGVRSHHPRGLRQVRPDREGGRHQAGVKGDALTAPAADLVLRGGNVLTLDRASRTAAAVAVRGERILAVGADREVGAHIGPHTRVVELAGRTLMPGLTDGHAHLDREGLKGLLPSLAGCRSIRELVERLADIAARTPPGRWIVTMPIGEPPEYRWSESMFEEGRLPTRADLDCASTQHPILIRCAWGYWSGQLPLVSFANSAALAAAGIGKGTESPSPLLEIEVD